MTDEGIRIRGLERCTRTLEAATADIADMADAHADAGQLIVQRAQPPVLTGTLRGSLKATHTPERLTLTAGVRYGAPVHAGAQGRPARPFFTEAINRSTSELEATYLEHINDALSQVKGI